MPLYEEQMLNAIEQKLLALGGATSATIDGATVTFDKLIEQRRYWQAALAKTQGRRPRISRIKLGGV